MLRAVHFLIFVSFVSAVLLGCQTSGPDKRQPKSSDKGFWSQRFAATYNIAYGQLPEQKLDIYRQGNWQGPPNYFVPGDKPKPTIIYIHGGAWHSGTKESALWSIMHFVQRGWNAVNIEYKSGGNTAPRAADDVLLAMQWLAEHADEYAIDRNNIVVSGDSAGGHLALLAGLTNNYRAHPGYLADRLKIKAIVNWFGIPDIRLLDTYLTENKRWNYPRKWAGSDDMFENIADHYSPINYVDKDSPAVLSIHGTADKVVPLNQSLTLHKKLDDKGVFNQLLQLENGRHLGFTDEQFQIINRDIFVFLEKVLADK